MNYPTIISAVNVGQTTQINGTLDFLNPANVKVEIFKSNNNNFFQHGGAIEYIGSTLVNPNGTWSFSTNLISSADVITATATDTMGNTSEFNAIQSITVSVPTVSQSDDFNIYPMPVNNTFTISYPLDKTSDLLISIYSVEGKKVADLYNQTAMQGENRFTFNVDYLHLKPGMYFVKVARDLQMEKTLKFIKN